jgi:hypothetical protein
VFDHHRLLMFVGKAFISILIFSSFWWFVAPSYTSLLAAASDSMAPSTTVMKAVDNTITIQIQGQASSATMHTLPYQTGLLLLLGLIVATPRLKPRQRLEYAAVGAVATFALHVVTVLAVSGRMQSMSPLLFLFVSLGVDLFPILIWAALSAKYWWPGGAMSGLAATARPRAVKRG